MKHTPGPWTNSGGTIESADGWHVASVHGNGGDQLANARLIAAAPEMLELLEAALVEWDDEPYFEEFPDHNKLAEKTRALTRRVIGEK